MIFIHILIVNISDEHYTAYTAIFNDSGTMFPDSTVEFSYPKTATREEIKNEIQDRVHFPIEDYSLAFDHVGGRPNDR